MVFQPLISERQRRLRMKKNKARMEDEFHAVEFMRKVRGELTEQYLLDKQKYLDFLKKAMEEFKLRQKETCSQGFGAGL